MKSHITTHVFALALLLAGCAGSDDGDGTATSPSVDGFITKEEAAEQASGQAATGTESDFIAEPPSGIAGSGIVIAEPDQTAWQIPNDGANFTGPPLQAGDGPSSADSCPDQDLVVTATEAAGEQICFFSEDDPNTPAARIDQVVETVEGEDFVRIRLTLNPNFVDNSYGETAVGWGQNAPDQQVTPPPKGGKKPKAGKGQKTHTFKDLVGSDHAEMQLTDSNGDVVLHFKVDYLSEDQSAPSGYSSLGVTGGEGKILVGDPAWILQATSSLDRNLNACGYDTFTENSPAPVGVDSATEAGNWDYRVVYEVWVSLDAFGDADFGAASIEFVHASPSKASNNTVEVTAGPCPPDDDPPESDEPPPGGSGGSSSTPSGGSGGTETEPVNIPEAR
jgi:hypothetical protein